jgi:site-specific DNA recombinase
VTIRREQRRASSPKGDVPIRAAVYARKSTDDSDRDPENKSVTRQRDNAHAYAKSRGWIVDDDHVFMDDGISGAEFGSRRPGLLRLLNHLRDFDVVVMSELSRLGRDQVLVSKTLADIEAAGVHVHFYLTREELRFDSAIDRFLVSALAFGAELEREKASERSRDALERKAQKGYNTGGCVYGYDNIWVFTDGREVTPEPGQKKDSSAAHTDYRVNEKAADVIRRIFQMYSDGYGHVTIAKTLNGDPRYSTQLNRYFDGLLPPKSRAGKRGTGSWAPSSIRGMLHNKRYAGYVPFGEYRNARRNGRGRIRVKQEEFIEVCREELRIVPADLWERVQERLKGVAKTYLRGTHGELWGRPGRGVESRYLLTGLGECGVCGHNISMLGGRAGVPGKRTQLYYYGCSYHVTRGRTICSNDHKARMTEADETIIAMIERTVLTPNAVDYVIENALSLIEEQRRHAPELPERIKAEIAQDERQLTNFLSLIGEGRAPVAVLTHIKALEVELAAKRAQLEALRVAAPTELDLRRTKKELREMIGRFSDVVRGDVPLARQALRKLLDGRIQFMPAKRNGQKTYDLRCQLRVAGLLPPGYKAVASPRGFAFRALRPLI